MIEINLIPLQLRKKTRKLDMSVPMLPRFTLLQVIIGTVSILAIINISLAGLLIMKKTNLLSLTKRWDELRPIKEQLDIVKADMMTTEERVRTVEQLTTKNKIIWSEKLNIISDVMPNGVWLRRIYISSGNLEIEGSAVSKRGEEMILVGRLANNLKSASGFSSVVSDIDVSLIQRRKIGPVEVVDFVIRATYMKDPS